MRWDDLQFVLAVAEAGSLSGAARALGVNHATVLRRVTGFEAAHGVTLFERPPGGYRLRPEARAAIAEMQAIGERVARLERVLPAMGRDLSGAFRLTTTDTIAHALLPRHVSALTRLNPDLTVELIVANAPVDMERAEAEITIRPANSLPQGLTGLRISGMTFRVFGAPEYLAANPSRRINDHPWLGVAPPLTRSPVAAWQEENLAAPPVVKADSFLTLARMVEAGMGLAMVPSFLAHENPRLVEATRFGAVTRTNLWVAAHPDLAATERTSAVIGFLQESLMSDAAVLEG